MKCQPRFDLLPVCLTRRIGVDLLSLEEFCELCGQFFEGRPCQTVGIILTLVERDESHVVSLLVHAVFASVKRILVGVQAVHFVEVGVSDSNYDDGHGLLRASHQFVDGGSGLHVCDDSIGNY